MLTDIPVQGPISSLSSLEENSPNDTFFVHWVFLSCEIALCCHYRPASDNIFKTSVSAEIKNEFCK